MKAVTALLPTLVAAIALPLTQAHAQTTFGPGLSNDGYTPRPELTEAERAERRKAYAPTVYPKFMQGGDRPDIKPAEPPIVYFDQPEEPGTIIVDTANKKLYYVLPGKKAYAYPISVGRDGFTWNGVQKVTRKAEWPDWHP
ncbi:MAG: L,D-transpeptidase family protein, partial [Hyphomicrobiaceae bacterium]|nr:L,D-transpeptidase family protein [Hyphomicrobiaceae bacterium]